MSNSVSIKESLKKLLCGEGSSSLSTPPSHKSESVSQSQSSAQFQSFESQSSAKSQSSAQSQSSATSNNHINIKQTQATQDEGSLPDSPSKSTPFPGMFPTPKVSGMDLFVSLKVCSPTETVVLFLPVDQTHFKVEMTDTLSCMKVTMDNVPYKLFALTDAYNFFEDENRLNLLLRQKNIATPYVLYGDFIKILNLSITPGFDLHRLRSCCTWFVYVVRARAVSVASEIVHSL